MELQPTHSTRRDKYFCDYCDTYLTHDSPSVRKTHCNGRKHKENVRVYYQKWMEEQAQQLIDQTTAAFQAGKIPNNPFPNAAGQAAGNEPGAKVLPPAILQDFHTVVADIIRTVADIIRTGADIIRTGADITIATAAFQAGKIASNPFPSSSAGPGPRPAGPRGAGHRPSPTPHARAAPHDTAAGGRRTGDGSTRGS
ncbi:hypothetical protein Bbelb_093730, partial [Branchiostoma belcheri]